MDRLRDLWAGDAVQSHVEQQNIRMLHAMLAFLQCTCRKGSGPWGQRHAVSVVELLEHQYDVIQCAGIIVKHADAYAANVRIPPECHGCSVSRRSRLPLGRFMEQWFSLQLSADSLCFPLRSSYIGTCKASAL